MAAVMAASPMASTQLETLAPPDAINLQRDPAAIEAVPPDFRGCRYCPTLWSIRWARITGQRIGRCSRCGQKYHQLED